MRTEKADAGHVTWTSRSTNDKDSRCNKARVKVFAGSFSIGHAVLCTTMTTVHDLTMSRRCRLEKCITR